MELFIMPTDVLLILPDGTIVVRGLAAVPPIDLAI